ncbi:dolichyl-diphosphooligosaccharide--protein glycosyltransferase subunit 1 [Savitreella phatthalungensis]
MLFGLVSLLVLPVLAFDNVPPVWRVTNALRTIDLTKTVQRDNLAVILENLSKEPQSVVYLPLEVGKRQVVLEAKEKGKTNSEDFLVTQESGYWAIQIPRLVLAKEQITLVLTTATFDTLEPKPARIEQNGKHYLSWSGDVYVKSAYAVEKQKTKVKLPSSDVQEHSGDGNLQGSTVTYGPFKDVAGGEKLLATIRYEATAPIAVVRSLARDIEVSHWGGNIAFEDSYSLTNRAAQLAKQFDRIAYSQSAFYNPKSTAIRGVRLNLPIGTRDAYFVDEIGNVSTSRFRSNAREAVLELKPRYPIFGNWNYTFVVGWNNDLSRSLLRQDDTTYVLRVPFMEGPNDVIYERASVRVVLPEGANVLSHKTTVGVTKVAHGVHKTFGDTLGRPTLTFLASDLVEETARGEIVVEYQYTTSAMLRKPLVLFSAFAGLFLLKVIASKII